MKIHCSVCGMKLDPRGMSTHLRKHDRQAQNSKVSVLVKERTELRHLANRRTLTLSELRRVARYAEKLAALISA